MADEHTTETSVEMQSSPTPAPAKAAVPVSAAPAESKGIVDSVLGWWDAHVIYPMFRWGTNSTWVQPMGGRWVAENVADINYAEAIVGALLIAIMTVVGSGEAFGSACSFTTGALMVPVSRRGLFVTITGISYERGIKYHRWIAHLLFVYCCVHGISQGGYFGGKGLTGTLAWIILGVMLVLSLPWMRRHKFDLFYYTHVLFVGFLVLGVLHAGATLIASIVPLLLYAADLFLRVSSGRQRHANVEVRVVGEDCVELSFDKSADFAYHAGQYCFVSFPRLGTIDVHPFTMSSAPHEARVTMHIRALGDWTRKLLEVTKTDAPALQRVCVLAPYGEHRCLTAPANFSMLKMVGGGIGITPVMALLKHFAHERVACGVARRVQAVWLARTPEVFPWFADSLAALREHFPGIASAGAGEAGDGASEADAVRVDVFATRAKEAGEAHGLAFGAGRPDWAAMFAAWHKEAVAVGERRVAVFACGPHTLCFELRAQCSEHSDGDVTFHFLEETFEF